MAVPKAKRYGEMDYSPEDELTDPMPLIKVHHVSRSARRVRDVGAGATVRLVVRQGDCLSDVSLSAARAGDDTVRAVGIV